MKKILRLLMLSALLTVGASATGGDANFCEERPTSPICGTPGADGADGYTPVKGVDYFDGQDGYTPVKGVDYFDGQDGESIKGDKGDAGESIKGDKGDTGDAGADFNSEELETKLVGYSITTQSYIDTYNEVIQRQKDLVDYTHDVGAMGMAAALLDFSTTAEGISEIAVSIGYSHSEFGNGTAGAIGIKHGLTDTESVLFKFTGTDNETYMTGVGFSHRF